MNDILQESNASPVSLDDLVTTNPPTTEVPHGAVRNRAATSALLAGDSSKLVDNYRLLMAEGSVGDNTTHNEVMQGVANQSKAGNMAHVINILGDKNIPMDQKRKVMNVVQTDGFKEEPAITLQTKALVAPSKDEDIKGEAARISLSDTMREINQEAQERQRMMNGLIASHPEPGLSTVGDVAATDVMPFGRNAIGANVAAKMDELDGKTSSIGSWVKNFLLPGSTKADLQERLMNIPPAQRGNVTAKLINAVKDSAAVFHGDNYYAQYQTAVRLLDEPTHTNSEVWTENMMTVLDAFWVGGEAMNLAKAGRTAATAGATDTASKARRPGSANPGVSDAENVVHKADWELVPDPAAPHNPFAARIGNPKQQLEYKRADAQKHIELNSVVRQENPVAPFNLIEQANPSAARDLHEAIVAGTDEVSEALTGVSRDQAIINNIAPQAGTKSGSVLNKVDQTLKDQVQNTGATRYTPEEFNGAVEGITRDFRNAYGLQINDTMTTIRVDGDHVLIDGHYTTPGGAFVTPDAAREQAKYSLRDYGIRDDEITVMKRDGMTYTPITSGENTPGDYMIKVSTKHAVDVSEIRNWNPLDVKRNWTDRISQTVTEDKGGLSGSLMDPGSMLHPVLTGSASIASDQAVVLENMLLKPIREFRNEVSAMPKERPIPGSASVFRPRQAIEEYIKEANTNGIKMDHFDLISRGFNSSEISALQKWKDIGDSHFYLENLDLVRTLNGQGHMIFENQNTKLFGKPVPKNQNIKNVYDPASNNVRTLTQAEMDSLYNTGGHYVSLRRPINIGGTEVEHMMVRNTPQEYMRKVRDTDQVLNYRDGYYTVGYKKGSKFIDEITHDASGKETRRTVAVAGNTSDAKTFANAQQASTGNLHVIREDSRGFAKDGDGYWDVNSASGRISQRLRGQPLQQATGINQIGAGVYIDNPMESAARAAKSVAGRTVGRPMLEAGWARFKDQYADLLPSNGMGGKRLPQNMTEIVDHFDHTSSRVADARTTYTYLNFMERGYINTADQLYKGGMNVVANMLGSVGLSKAENIAQAASRVSPTHAIKGAVFNAYIVGANPIRQWIVQAHQATRMAAYNPIGFANGGMLKRIVSYIGEHSTIPGAATTNAEMKAFIKFVDDSGMVAGVDRNSLVRGLGLELADSSSNLLRGVETTRAFMQTIGFDIGEKMNQLGHLAAVHEKYVRQGANLADKSVRDIALTEARALSYDLNKAGELTYTQSSPAMILQFLQMPHKAMLQLTNRKLSTPVALRLAAWDLVMFGVGGSTVLNGLRWLWTKVGDGDDSILPDDPEKRDIFVYGMESFALNQFLSRMDESGERSRVDFSALASNDMDGWAKMFHATVDQGPMAALAASPGGQLLAVDGVMGSRRNGRIPQAIITMGRFLNEHVFDATPIDPEHPTEFTAVLNDVAKISSGWTAVQNAKLMLETRKKMDSSGVVISDKVTIPEAWMQGMGFGKLSTKELYDLTTNLAKENKTHQEDVLSRYRDILNYYKDELSKEGGDLKHTQLVTAMLMKTFDQPGDLDIIVKQWQKDSMGKEQQLFMQMMRASGIVDSKHMEDNIKMWNVDEQQKSMMLDRTKAFREMTKHNKGN